MKDHWLSRIPDCGEVHSRDIESHELKARHGVLEDFGATPNLNAKPQRQTSTPNLNADAIAKTGQTKWPQKPRPRTDIEASICNKQRPVTVNWQKCQNPFAKPESVAFDWLRIFTDGRNFVVSKNISHSIIGG